MIILIFTLVIIIFAAIFLFVISRITGKINKQEPFWQNLVAENNELGFKKRIILFDFLSQKNQEKVFSYIQLDCWNAYEKCSVAILKEISYIIENLT